MASQATTQTTPAAPMTRKGRRPTVRGTRGLSDHDERRRDRPRSEAAALEDAVAERPVPGEREVAARLSVHFWPPTGLKKPQEYPANEQPTVTACPPGCEPHGRPAHELMMG